MKNQYYILTVDGVNEGIFATKNDAEKEEYSWKEKGRKTKIEKNYSEDAFYTVDTYYNGSIENTKFFNNFSLMYYYVSTTEKKNGYKTKTNVNFFEI